MNEGYSALRMISPSRFIKKGRYSGEVNVGIEKPAIIQTLCSHSLTSPGALRFCYGDQKA